LRIGVVTGEYPPMQGGVGAFTERLVHALKATNPATCEIHVITDRRARPDPARRLSWREWSQPVALPHASLHPHVRSWRWPALSTIADVVARYDLDLVNIQYQAAAYHMGSAAINFLPWRLKGLAPTVVTFHDLRVPYLFPKAGRLRQMAVRFMARQARGVIVTNSADHHALTSDLAEEKLRQIPIGSNIAVHLLPAERITAVRRRLGLTAEHCLLGYFGFLNESKGADTLLSALARLGEQTHLVFIGGRTGDSDPHNNQAFYNHLDGLIGELDLNGRVHWTGFVSDEEVSAYLQAADLMVMPYRDGVSLRRGTFMAALAHGRPLLTTPPAITMPELLHGQNVYFSPVDDVATLVQSIQTLWADAYLRIRLGKGATQLADSFTWSKIAGETAAFFHEVVGDEARTGD
jgi:glycosyltransferase involved in cell wall biosynthesis